MNWPPTYLQWFLIVSLPLMGLVYAFLGGIKLSLAKRLGLDEAQVGGLVGGFGTMVGPTILACGFLTDAFGRKWIFVLGALGVVAALLVLAAARAYRGAVLGVLLLGAGWSATINVGNVLMLIAAAPGKLTQAMQFGDFLFGLGALVTPIVLAALLGRLGYRSGVTLLAVVALLPVAMAFFAGMDPPAPATPEAAAPARAGLADLFAGPHWKVFWLSSLAFLFYVPLESALAGWATTIVSRQDGGGSSNLASFSLMAFWLCFTGSRLLVALLGIEDSGSEWLRGALGINVTREALLIALSAASVALLLGIATVSSQGAAVGLVVAAGLVFGPIFPILISKVLGAAPAGVEGRAVGFFFAFGSVGWTFIPRLIGHVAARTNIRRGFLVAAASSVVSLAFVLAGHFLARD